MHMVRSTMREKNIKAKKLKVDHKIHKSNDEWPTYLGVFAKISQYLLKSCESSPNF